MHGAQEGYGEAQDAQALRQSDGLLVMVMDISKITGILICYMNREEMDKVYARLNDLKQKDEELKDVVLSKAFNMQDEPYPWTIGLLVMDQAKLGRLDDYLTDNRIELGNEKELYAGELRVQEFLRMVPINGKYIPGIVLIKTGACPRKAVIPVCSLCPTGHLLECHYPDTCDIAQCQHLERYNEF